MKRPRLGINYASVAQNIAQALSVTNPPKVKVGRGRISVIFRQLGASRWPVEARMEYAFQIAGVTRAVFAGDHRRLVRRRANRAIVVVFEDVLLEQGCDVAARWQIVVPRQG